MWNGQIPALDIKTSRREKVDTAADTIWVYVSDFSQLDMG